MVYFALLLLVRIQLRLTVWSIYTCQSSTNPLAFAGELLLDSFLYFYGSFITCVSPHMRVASPVVSYVGKQNLCPLQRLSGLFFLPGSARPLPTLRGHRMTLLLDGQGRVGVFTVHAFALLWAEGLAPYMDGTACAHLENNAVAFAFKSTLYSYRPWLVRIII